MSYSIGTERESALHRTLKFHYAGVRGTTEKTLEGYVCDGVSERGEIIEVQTGSFAPLRQKAPELTRLGPLRIVHPIVINKYILLFDIQGRLIRRRKSPRKGCQWDLFENLLYAPELPCIPGLSIELAFIDAVEKRIDDGKGSWRRKGVSISGRELTAWHKTLSLESPGDYRRFVPFKDGEEFTGRELGKKAGISPSLARKTLYVLTKLNMVNRVGKRGKALVYTANFTPAAGGKKKREGPLGPHRSHGTKTVSYQASDISSSSRLDSAKRSVTARRSSK
jgi:hypothetical protein